jgi:ankyrin repeat protein
METRNFEQAKKSAEKPKGESKKFLAYVQSGNVAALRHQFADKKAIINGLYLMSAHKLTSQTRVLSPVHPLQIAICYQQWEAVEFLLENGADPNAESFPAIQAEPIRDFHYFIIEISHVWQTNQKPIISIDQLNKLLHLFLEKGADFSANRADLHVLSSLMLGVALIKFDFFQKLIAKMGRETFQASLENSRSMLSRTGTRVLCTPALHILCTEPFPMLLELFLRNGANPLEEANGFAPLTVCTEQLRLTRKSALLPLAPATKEALRKTANSYGLMIDILIRHLGERVKLPHSLDRFTYLHDAAARNMCDVATKLLACGLDVNTFSGWGETPIYLAAVRGHIEMVRLLAETPGCDLMLGKKPPEASNEILSPEKIKRENQTEAKEGKQKNVFLVSATIPVTPLSGAFLCGQEAVARYLLEKSSHKVKENLIEEMRVALPQLDEAQRAFLSKFPDIESAASSQTYQLGTHSDAIELFLESGEEDLAIAQWKTLKKEDIELSKVFIKAILLGTEKFIRFLCAEYTVDMETLFKSDTETAYLGWAISYLLGQDTIDLLLDRGAPIIHPNTHYSAIHFAIERNHIPALSRLLARFPASVDIQSGVTPLFTAVSLDCDEAATMLLASKADPLVLNEEKNKNPLLLLIRHKKQRLLQHVFEQFPQLDLSPSNPSNVNMPYLTEAYQNRDANLFVTLFEHGARDTHFLRFSPASRWLMNLNRKEITEWEEKVKEERRARASESPSLLPASEYSESTPTASGKKPYRDAWRTQASDVADGKSATQSTDVVYDRKLFLFKPDSEIFIWLETLSSAHATISAITGSPNLFLYLDEARLIDQGLSLETIQDACIAPRLNGDNIKSLPFKHIQCSISLNGNTQSSYLMAELRFPRNQALKEKRIFLWPVQDKTGRATLLVGFDLSNALHEHKDIKALVQSFKTPKTIELSAKKPVATHTS